ncbi:MAG TPA: cytidylate kinase-like family protein [Clostridiales bacterium]|nr:cytidylate kinase-like family protein [Clostridiales bacterium]
MKDQYVITIARGYGSGGRTMGKLLSEELGIHYYDRELLRLASDKSGINESIFEKADEKLKKSILYRIARKEYKGEQIPPDSDDFVSNDNLFNFQAKVIKGLADQESCVIVGRCADYILRDRKNVVKIFIHASLEDCVIRLEDMFSLSKSELEKKIKGIDKRRADYYKHFTGRDWNVAQNYDLCLNSQQLGYDKCIEIVKSYLEVRFS